MRYLFFLVSICSFGMPLHAQEDDDRCNDPKTQIECGWHYGHIDPLGELKVEDNKPTQPMPEEEAKEPEEKEKKETCTNKSNWSESCGFIDPGEDFDFQAMQRDIFLKNLLMKSNDPQSVENMQRYQKWLISKAVQASKMWEFNLAQKPELSASVNNPVTSFGIAMATQLRDDTTASVIQEIRAEGGIYVWFTRSDCPYCHRQTMLMREIESENDIEIRNVSLDQYCMIGFEEDCIKAPESIEPAKALNISIVPSFFVYMPKDKTWIRISNGIDSKSTILNRIKNFFIGVKSAHVNGINNSDGNRPNVDFSKDDDLRLQGIRTLQGNSDEN